MNAARIHPWKRRIKGQLKQYRLGFVRWRYGFGPDELSLALQQLGVAKGDVLMVHSSMDRFEAFTGKTSEILTVLRATVGHAGLLLMPTLPFTGTALEWVQSNTLFDVQTTPSRSGLLTELFRRSPDVVRSVHPTHAMAALGERANRFCQDHAICTTPCGIGSPYAKLLETNGKILFLGAPLESMTFFHTVEAILEPRMPVSPFTSETFQIQSRTATGDLVTTTTRLFNPELSRRRKMALMIPCLQSRPGEWRHARLGTVDLLLLNAQGVLTTLTDMAARGQFCYDL
ncbi:MAG: AAC(3) family N-acetyltransferase [Magnetococcus sp. YQC-5]